MANDEAKKMFETMQQFTKDMPGLILPPPIFTELEGEILEVDIDGKTLKGRFPNQSKHHNPIGYIQGGILVAQMDAITGALSFMVAPPSVTTQFNTSYMRPVTPEDKYVYITATVTESTRRQLYITARAHNAEDKTFAIGHTVSRILGD